MKKSTSGASSLSHNSSSSKKLVTKSRKYTYQSFKTGEDGQSFKTVVGAPSVNDDAERESFRTAKESDDNDNLISFTMLTHCYIILESSMKMNKRCFNESKSFIENPSIDLV